MGFSKIIYAAVFSCFFGAPGILFAQKTEPKISAEHLLFFEKNIRPLLVENCYSCHSAKSEKAAKGGLYMDTRDGLLRGGSSGPALVPGNAEKSLVIKAVRYTDEDLQMPPKDKKLSDEQIALLEEWVRMGAPDPRASKGVPTLEAMDISKAKGHWAFRPVAKPSIPKPPDTSDWMQTDVDAFVLLKLQEKGLSPSPTADRRTLIRRATYDLTGLPPTPAEAKAFLDDTLPTTKAFAKVVDRLLDSPRYGERWGRHWLDVARYADTTGDRNNRGDTRYPYSWTYRDYVVNAFNNDLPYDRFILEQIAADRLPRSSDNQSLAALGFLTVGKRFMNNLNDVIDDRIDVVTQGFLGLTVSCARCHDHKFDPIPTKDYYALHGVFNSTIEPEDKPVLGKFEETEEYRDYLRQLARVDEETAAFRQRELQRLSNSLRENISDYLMADKELTSPNDPAKNNIARKRKLDVNLLDVWGQSLRRMERRGDAVLRPWFAFASVPQNNFSAGAAQIQTALKAGSLNGIAINPVVAGAFNKIEINSLADVADAYQKLFAQAEKPSLLSVASGDADEEDDAAPAGDVSASWVEIRETLEFGSKGMQLDDRQTRRILGNQFQNRLSQITTKKVALHLNHPGSPPRAMLVNDALRARNSRVLIRGERANFGPEAPRQFLEILSGPNRKPFRNGSGRLDLARAITSPQNPLTARVMVNRVWQKHFGQAIVRTPSDFGLRSEPPAHPELLDYLSSYFMQNGWSVKKLHRLIMLSSVYMQSSLENEVMAKKDPENKYLWRMNLQRLEFEAMRDTLLFLGGKMDANLGGSPFPVSQLSTSPRRTLYATVDRLALPESFRVFDFANPDMTSGQRYLTTVPQQALFFMNSQIVAEQASNLAARDEVSSAKDDSQKVRALFELAYQRGPSEKELALALKFLASQKEIAITTTNNDEDPANTRVRNRRMRQRPQSPVQQNPVVQLNALERYTQVLLQSNELVFVN